MRKKLNSGFTLVEMLTALAIFAVIMTISMGSILGIFESDRKAKSIRSVMGNLNIALESMAREMRFGTSYHCGTQGSLTTPRNCTGGDDFISFLSSDGEQIVYRLRNNSIERSDDGGGRYTVITAPEVVIDDLTFYTLGAGTGNTLQPKVLLKVIGRAGSGETASDFTLQTLVSQRDIDR